jgi:integrase/recombinase XerD
VVVQDYLAHLAVERGVAANTLAAYGRDLRRYLDHLGGVAHLGDVSEAQVAGFLAALRAGDEDHPALSASSAARAVVAVRGLHRFAARDGIVPDDVARAVRPPAPPRRLPKAISVDEVERLLEAAGFDGTPLARRDRALVEILYGTGARISEAVGLAVDDLQERDAVVLHGKGGKERVVPIGRAAVEALRRYLARAQAWPAPDPAVALAKLGDLATARHQPHGHVTALGWSFLHRQQ